MDKSPQINQAFERAKEALAARGIRYKVDANSHGEPVLEILPLESGSELNLLAEDMHKRLNVQRLYYSPYSLDRAGVLAGYVERDHAAYLSHQSILDGYPDEMTFHEIMHGMFRENYINWFRTAYFTAALKGPSRLLLGQI